MAETDSRVNFDLPATLRKWPSLNNERLREGRSAYLVFEGTLDECIREFMRTHRAEIARNILAGAATGERDPIELERAALTNLKITAAT